MSSQIIHGDALDVVRGLAPGSIDAVVTDPPYAITSEASSSVSRVQRAVRETQFFGAWLREHLGEWVRVLKPTGAIWMTIDWRGAMALDDACARLNLREPKVGVWDRECIGLGHLLRNSYECFAIVTLAEFKRQRADEPDLWRHRWTQGGRESDHKAEKPVDLLRRACRLVASPGALILDPFAGSGSTGVAALAEGMRFIGIEREAEHCETARRRLSAPPPDQQPLFGESPLTALLAAAPAAPSLRERLEGLASAARAVVDRLRASRIGRYEDQFPGHGHLVPGIWDTSAPPALAGKPCEDCAAWNALRSLLSSTGKEESDGRP